MTRIHLPFVFSATIADDGAATGRRRLLCADFVWGEVPEIDGFDAAATLVHRAVDARGPIGIELGLLGGTAFLKEARQDRRTARLPRLGADARHVLVAGLDHLPRLDGDVDVRSILAPVPDRVLASDREAVRERALAALTTYVSIQGQLWTSRREPCLATVMKGSNKGYGRLLGKAIVREKREEWRTRAFGGSDLGAATTAPFMTIDAPNDGDFDLEFETATGHGILAGADLEFPEASASAYETAKLLLSCFSLGISTGRGSSPDLALRECAASLGSLVRAYEDVSMPPPEPLAAGNLVAACAELARRSLDPARSPFDEDKWSGLLSRFECYWEGRGRRKAATELRGPAASAEDEDAFAVAEGLSP